MFKQLTPEQFDINYLLSIGYLLDFESEAVLIISKFNDGFLTSAGFSETLLVPDSPIYLDDYDMPVMFHSAFARELPFDFLERQYMFSNCVFSFSCISQIKDFILSTGNLDLIDKLFFNMLEVDYDIDNDITDYDYIDYENKRFKSTDGNSYSWCLLLPKNYFVN